MANNQDIDEEIARLKEEIEELRRQMKQQCLHTETLLTDNEEDEDDEEDDSDSDSCEPDEDFGMYSCGSVCLSNNSVIIGNGISVINGRVYGRGFVNGQQMYGNGTGKTVKASSTIIEKSYDVTRPFTQIENLSPFNVLFSQTADSSISVRGSKNIIEKYLSIKISRGTLRIDIKGPVTITGLIGKRVPKITISNPSLTSVNLYSSGNFKAKTDITTSSLSINIGGSGDSWFQNIISEDSVSLAARGSSDVHVGDVKCADADISISGSGGLYMGGVTAKGNNHITVTGSGNTEFSKLRSKELYIKVTGSGDVSVQNVEVQSIKTGVSGSGDVRLSGKAKRASYGVRGSGGISASSLSVEEASAVASGSGDITCCASQHFEKQSSGSSSIRNVGSAQDKRNDFWDDF